MISPRIKQIFRLQRIVMWLFGLTIGLLVSAATEWFVAQGSMVLFLAAAAVLVLGAIILFFIWRQSPTIEVAIRSPLTIRSAEEERLHARRGFIGFVPIYTPQRGTPAAQLLPQERTNAIETRDFGLLQFQESNFFPTIKAIMSHATRLEHCWLLSTQGKNSPGSAEFAPLLAAYLRQEQGLKCKFYYGDVYTIALDDDALILSKTYDQIQRVLAQAARLDLAPRDIVADFTTGVRSMTLGMVLACLNRDQDLEFVGTRYNLQGQPEGDLFPIIFSFEPLLTEKG